MVEDITLVNTVTGEKLELSMTSMPSYILKSVDWGQSKAPTTRISSSIKSVSTSLGQLLRRGLSQSKAGL